MTARRRDGWETATKLALVAVLVYPLLPTARVRWFYTTRILQHVASEVGTLALAAENRYYQEVGDL